jgi:hypothetical protein
MGTNRNSTSQTAGRPSKRSEETLRVFFAAAETGAPIKACCAVAGIHPDTWKNWKAEDDTLQDRFEEAREKGRVKCLKVLQDASGDDWRAAEAFLKLAFRTDYSPRAEVAIEGGGALVIGAGQIASLQEGYKRLREDWPHSGQHGGN